MINESLFIPLVTLGVAILAIVIILSFTGIGKFKSKRMSGIALIGILFLFLGAYFFPLGAMEAYEVTREYFGLSFIQNLILWYGLCFGLIAFGIFAMFLARKKK